MSRSSCHRAWVCAVPDLLDNRPVHDYVVGGTRGAIMIWWNRAGVMRVKHEGTAIELDPSRHAGSGGRIEPAVRAWGERVVGGLAADFELLHVSVFIHDPSAGALRLVAQHWGIGADRGDVLPGDWLVPLHGSVCGWVFRSASPALVNDVSRHGEYFPFPGATVRSELAVPIVLDGRPVGVVNLESPRVGGFRVEDVDLVRAHAASAASTLPAALVGRALAVDDDCLTGAGGLC